MADKGDEIRKLLLVATQQALDGLETVFESAYYKGSTPLLSVLTTLARLKMMEVSMLQSARSALALSSPELAEIRTDIGKFVLLKLVSSGALPSADATAMYKEYAIEEQLTKAEKGLGAHETVSTKAAESARILSEALIKIGELRGDD